MNRFWVAIGAYLVLAILAWKQLDAPIPHSNFQLRHVVIAILAALAFSTYLHRRDREAGEDKR